MRQTRSSLRLSKRNDGARLPFELLSHIFLLNRPEFSNVSHLEDVVDPFPYLVRMSSVCSWWRQVVLQCRSLWTTIHFVLRFTPTCRQKYETILERSGNMDLAVYISQPRYEAPGEIWSASNNAPLTLMLRRARIIGVFSRNPVEKFPDFQFFDVPRLKHFMLDSWSTPVVDLFPFPAALESVLYTSDRSLTVVEERLIAQSSPRSLTLDVGVLGDDRIQILQKLPNLEQLSITHDFIAVPQHLSHSTLTHLIISGPHTAPNSILGALPNLAHLTFCSTATEPGRKRDHGGDLRCSMSPLTALKTLTIRPMSDVYDYAHHVPDLVAIAPGLVALELWDENALDVASRLAGTSPETEDSSNSTSGTASSQTQARELKPDTAPNSSSSIHESLRLIRIGFAHLDALEWLEPMSAACAQILDRCPDMCIEWRDLSADLGLASGGSRVLKKKQRARFNRILKSAPEGVSVSVSKWEALSGMFEGGLLDAS